MKWLEKCISSVVNSNIPSDMFIVDNGSSDGSVEYIKEKAPQAILVQSKENLGFGRANNLGIKYAVENGYDYVYLLNQDAWIESDTLSKLISISRNNPEYGILSPLQTNKDKTRLDKIFSTWCPNKLSSDLLCGQPIKEIYTTRFVMAAHWMIPIDVLKKVGGFSPAFRHYGEDNNMINRMQYKGYKIGIIPSTMCVHDRELRPYTKEKADYQQYVNTVIMLNNPQIHLPFLSLMKRNLMALFYPRNIVWKYYFCSFKDYIKSLKYRKQYKRAMPFLN